MKLSEYAKKLGVSPISPVIPPVSKIRTLSMRLPVSMPEFPVPKIKISLNFIFQNHIQNHKNSDFFNLRNTKREKIKIILGNFKLGGFTEKLKVVQTGSAYIKTLNIKLKFFITRYKAPDKQLVSHGAFNFSITEL
ncbi:hypothetical protein [Brasilonema sp. UFV-L1]|uniref:hypothetical protein n=1 Tax=Brasilonema sp. UFV-L1 TaxID=2234130 RepID=UPI00145E0FF1|nr:hypothetical protein [Brasilonema sp. UFV-L1]